MPNKNVSGLDLDREKVIFVSVKDSVSAKAKKPKFDRLVCLSVDLNGSIKCDRCDV